MNYFYRHRLGLGIVSLILAVAVTFGVCFFALSKTAAASSSRFTVVIDAGHGGIDGGVVGRTTGVKESDVNLAISRYLQAEFERAGFYVVQTRPTEDGLYGTTSNGYKRRDMQKRKEIIEKTSPTLVISVHQNFFSLPSRRGAQVFFRSDLQQSVALASSIQAAFNGADSCVKQSSPLAGDYYMLNCTDYPAVIVECGFLSNAEDEALLVTAEYQKEVAKIIVDGALDFLTSGASTS